ncbi:hypothetical protein MUK42_06488 [Musa troglodytarum]|uniref:Uncharacterized protein n=1 Tax=Musa troglodytarum TaxID=320322 RepID=A0A9E7GB40_9LILI|nr:hypothetical protein MUK42_06488 [Musa troglodytarum]
MPKLLDAPFSPQLPCIVEATRRTLLPQLPCAACPQAFSLISSPLSLPLLRNSSDSHKFENLTAIVVNTVSSTCSTEPTPRTLPPQPLLSSRRQLRHLANGGYLSRCRFAPASLPSSSQINEWLHRYLKPSALHRILPSNSTERCNLHRLSLCRLLYTKRLSLLLLQSFPGTVLQRSINESDSSQALVAAEVTCFTAPLTAEPTCYSRPHTKQNIFARSNTLQRSWPLWQLQQ